MTLLPYPAFRELFSSANLEISEQTYEKFAQYAAFLAEKNAVMNLTAITDPAEVAEKHFLDSVLPLTLADFPEGASLVDIGAGAGFPSLPMAIIRPDLCVTMVDSLQKRVNFLRETSEMLEISATCLHQRAEDCGQTELRESFDIAVARAVSRLSVLSEYCLPLVKVGGMLAALKGADCGEEISAAKPAIKTLGGKIESVCEYALPNGDKRTLVVVRKIAATPRTYPRPQGKIKAKPL